MLITYSTLYHTHLFLLLYSYTHVYSAEPDPPKAHKALIKGGRDTWQWTAWDRIEINDNYNMTLNQLIQYVEKE